MEWVYPKYVLKEHIFSLRDNLLKSIFKIESGNCEDNVYNIAKHFFDTLPSMKVCYKCDFCKKNKNRNFAFNLVIWVNGKVDILKLEETLYIPTDKCCGKYMNYKVNVSPLVVMKRRLNYRINML